MQHQCDQMIGKTIAQTLEKWPKQLPKQKHYKRCASNYFWNRKAATTNHVLKCIYTLNYFGSTESRPKCQHSWATSSYLNELSKTTKLAKNHPTWSPCYRCRLPAGNLTKLLLKLFLNYVQNKLDRLSLEILSKVVYMLRLGSQHKILATARNKLECLSLTALA